MFECNGNLYVGRNNQRALRRITCGTLDSTPTTWRNVIAPYEFNDEMIP
jgi:hypothetical protein